MTRGLISNLMQHARRRPDAPAIVEVDDFGEGRSVSWRESLGCASVLATKIKSLPATNKIVLVSLPAALELPIAILGTLLADAVVFPVSPDMTATELSKAARESGATMLIGCSTARENLADDSVAWLPQGEVALANTKQNNHDITTHHRAQGALLLQSSGTTGMPRIARREMPALDAIAANCVAALSLSPADRMLMALPLHHSYGLEHGILTCVTAGITLELHKRFEPAWVAAALASGRVTHMPGVPFMFDVLAQTGAPRCHPSVRHIYSAGSPLPLSVSQAFERVTGVRLGQIYGATEYGSVTFNDPHQSQFDPLSTGLPMNGVGLRVLDPADPRVDRPLPAGREGQLALAAPSMLSTYVGEPSPTTRDGWLLTGDLARIDERGRLYVTGRLNLLIDIGGIKVNPFEIEAVLAQHPAVREVVVVPIRVSETVNRIRAVVLLHADAVTDAEGLRQFAQTHLSSHKVPRVFEIRPTLPRTPTGKVLRQVLQCS